MVALSARAVWALDSVAGVVRTLEPGGRPIRDLPISAPDAVDIAADELLGRGGVGRQRRG